MLLGKGKEGKNVMIEYLMLVTKNLASAASICDAPMPRMRMIQVRCIKDYAAFAPQSALKKFKSYLTRPVDGNKLSFVHDIGESLT